MKYLYVLRPSPLYAMVCVLPLILLSSLFLGAAYYSWPVLCIGAVICLLIAWYHYLQIIFIRYMISAEVLLISTGIFFKQTDSMELFRIKDYVITQPFWMQVFRLMNVQLISTDKTGPYVMLRGIPSSDLMDTLRELVQQARLRNHIIEIS
ncbi:MAG TPA: PH domain-containing protein [Bacteroidetes bacterium]|nr:PH domain-containing protein [Bacteroidota bacterium]